jgi:mRNA-degrading endonuclease YafQ of YafQ-DinJ toxin-antitoxin module
MRNVTRTKKFNKEFNKLDKHTQFKTAKKIRLFRTGEHDIQLRVHKLNGKLANKFAFSVEYDLRIVYSVINNEIELYSFEDIGTHNQVYR